MSEQAVVTVVILVIVVLILISQVVLVGRGKGPAAGMAVCRKCGRAFPRSFFGLNLLAGKLVRCPHCGAWAILPAASPAELELAEAREKGPAEQPAAPLSPEEALRRRIEQSKYEK